MSLIYPVDPNYNILDTGSTLIGEAKLWSATFL